ncbi:MAG: zinc-ribbon domain-containing protein [Desulfobacterales bacterium]|nr:zinc-ribbon domain-containing protein [Desulfobacterales bacterium]
MRFNCPKCGKTLKVADEMAGKRGRCPGCKTTVTIPQPDKKPPQVKVQKPPTPPYLPIPDQTFEIVQETGKKQKWQLSLYSDRLILHCPETITVVEILHDQAINKIKTAKLFFMPPVLAVKDSKKFSFRIKAGEYKIINEWIGKPLLLKMALKQRLRWCLLIGIIYILISLPLPGDPSSGLEAIPFDPIGMGLGITLLLLSISMRKMPGPKIFLADSVWFLFLLCYTLFQIFSGASIYWGIVIFLHITLIISGISHYRDFSDVQAV